MAKYEVKLTCSVCGKEFWWTGSRKNRKEADRQEEWVKENIKVCRQCRLEEEKRYEEERLKAAREWAAAQGLPELIGSQKQVEWAERLRYAGAGLYHPEKHSDVSSIERRTRALEYMFKNCVYASDWIEGRGIMDVDGKAVQTASLDMIFSWEKKYDEAQRGVDYATSEEFARYPEDKKKPGDVRITLRDDLVIAKYIKDEAFNKIVKGAGYSWSGERHAWVRRFNQFSGPAIDRAAELGNKLLCAGFGIRSTNTEVLDRAVAADYTPEQDRWIALVAQGEFAGWLSITVPTDALYQAARKLPKSKWSKPKVVVSVEYYKEVLDFADLNGYSISSGAQGAIEAEKTRRETVRPKKPENVVPDAGKKLAAILEQGDEVIDDLKD